MSSTIEVDEERLDQLLNSVYNDTLRCPDWVYNEVEPCELVLCPLFIDTEMTCQRCWYQYLTSNECVK